MSMIGRGDWRSVVGNRVWGEIEIGEVDEGACCQGGPYLFSDAALFTGSTRVFFDETAGALCSTMILDGHSMESNSKA